MNVPDSTALGRRVRLPPVRWLAAAVSCLAAVPCLAAGGCDRRPPLPAGATATAPASHQASRDVPFRLNYARTGYDGGAAPVGLKRAWTWKKEPYMMAASPMVRDGRVYAAGLYPDLNGTFGVICCVNAADGSTVWEVTELGGRDLKGIFSSPVLSADGRRLLIGEGMQWDQDCCVYCLDAADGKLLWKRPVGPHHVWNTPVVAGQTVVVGVGAIEKNNHQPVPARGYLLALRLSDGRELWRYDVKDPEGAPAVGDGAVYVPSDINAELVDAAGYMKALAEGDDYQPSAQALYALRLDDSAALQSRGQQRLVWRTTMPFPAGGAVALTDDLAIVGAGEGYFGFFWDDPGGAVVAVDRRSGNVRWQADLGQAVWGPVAVRDARVVCPVRGGDLAALDLRDGTVLWRQRLASGEPLEDADAIMDMLHAVHAGPAVTDKYVYAVSSEGWLFVLDAATGNVRERHCLNDLDSSHEPTGWSVSSPLIVAGRLYVGSETGGLQCFTAISGS